MMTWVLLWRWRHGYGVCLFGRSVGWLGYADRQGMLGLTSACEFAAIAYGMDNQ